MLRVSNRGFVSFSISHSIVNILLKYQYVTHFSITIYRPWVKGFERGICQEVGQWEVSRGCEGRLSGHSKGPVNVQLANSCQWSLKDPTVKGLSKTQTSSVSQNHSTMVSQRPNRQWSLKIILRRSLKIILRRSLKDPTVNGLSKSYYDGLSNTHTSMVSQIPKRQWCLSKSFYNSSLEN